MPLINQSQYSNAVNTANSAVFRLAKHCWSQIIINSTVDTRDPQVSGSLYQKQNKNLGFYIDSSHLNTIMENNGQMQLKNMLQYVALTTNYTTTTTTTSNDSLNSCYGWKRYKFSGSLGVNISNQSNCMARSNCITIHHINPRNQLN